MPNYSVKLGEIHVRSDRPITMEERAGALKQLSDVSVLLETESGLEIVLRLDGHGNGARIKPVR